MADPSAAADVRPVLSVEGLHVRYGAYEAVKGVSFTLGRGEILGIVGESGSGKSTIAKVLMGLHRDFTGAVTHPDGARPKLAMIFQDAVGSLNPRLTVGAALREVLQVHGGGTSGGLPAASRPLLDLVGLSPAVLDQYPRELSGGQCQRVSIARALATRPDVLIADEPVSALDVSVQARVLNLLRDLRRTLGLSILLIAHDLAVVKNVCDRTRILERGLFVAPDSPYARRLIAAVPRIPGASLNFKGSSSCR